MPVYEFECLDCKRDFEQLVMGSGSKIECPHCKGNNANKKMSVCGMSSGGKFTGSSGGPSCTGCPSSNCSTCH